MLYEEECALAELGRQAPDGAARADHQAEAAARLRALGCPVPRG
jgi:hypothetical protein